MKVAMIGAGSVVFSKNLTGDILSYPEFKDAAFSYMDIDQERLEVGVNLCRKAAKALGANPRIEGTMDLRKALDGADFVINMVQIGGFESTLVDFEIPRKYGLRFTIADTTGPGGFFRALRTFPMLRDLCRSMEEICPRAVLLNYSNPMSMNMQTVSRTSGIQAVGLCHSVQGTLSEIMHYIGEDPAQVSFVCAGINHMAFYLKLEKDGVDLYPRLFQALKDPKIYAKNKVRFELMRRLGHFVTESSEHNAEYNPYFIPHGKERVREFDVPLDEYLRRCVGIVGTFERLKKTSKDDTPVEFQRSHEYGSTIIHSLMTGAPSVIYGNQPNRGSIRNLPQDAIAEVAVLCDRAGLRPTTVGEIPPQLVGYMQPHIIQHELFIRAAMEGRRDHVYQAAMFDPLTAATLSPDQIVEMCDELIASHAKFLPKLDHPTMVPTSGKEFGVWDYESLEKSYAFAQAQEDEDYVKEWVALGPFRGAEGAAADVEFRPAVEEVLTSGAGGAIDTAKPFAVAGRNYGWKAVRVGVGEAGFANLKDAEALEQGAVAYAYAEVHSVHAREAELIFSHDNGLQVWLNGKQVYAWKGQRWYRRGSEKVTVQLRAGANHVLVKQDCPDRGFGFGLAVSKPNF